MEGKPEFNPDEMIKSREQLMKEILQYSDDLEKKKLKEFNQEETKKETIFHTGTLSDEEIHKLLFGTEISGEKLADKMILTIIRNFEISEVYSTVTRLKEIFILYPKLKLITEERLSALIKKIEDITSGYKDKRELVEKAEALREVLNQISSKKDK